MDWLWWGGMYGLRAASSRVRESRLRARLGPPGRRMAGLPVTEGGADSTGRVNCVRDAHGAKKATNYDSTTPPPRRALWTRRTLRPETGLLSASSRISYKEWKHWWYHTC